MKIVRDLTVAILVGVVAEEDLPDLSKYSLRQMLEANDIVRKSSHARVVPTEALPMRLTPIEDRFIAALYVLHHFEGESLENVKPIAFKPGKAVCVVETPKGYAIEHGAAGKAKQYVGDGGIAELRKSCP